MIRIMTALTAAALLAGCSTGGPKLDVNALMEDYYNQDRTYAALSLSGVTSLTVAGEDMTLIMEAPLNPLSMRNADPNAGQQMFETATRAALAGLGIYTAGQTIDTLGRQPRTVSPEIVRPEIVTVPGN
jgi:hypothetical protein